MIILLSPNLSNISEQVDKLQERRLEAISSNLRWIKDGPLNVVKKYEACIVNGFRFHTKNLERRRVTQNSGVVMSATTSSFSSSKDKNPIHGNVTYYGVLDEIVQLDYYGTMKIVLFKCDWIDVHRGVKQDGKFTIVNPSCRLRTNDPYVLASQVDQVWYVEDLRDVGWYIVRKTSPRDFFQMGDRENNDGDFIDIETIHNVDKHSESVIDDVGITWERDDVDGIEM